MANCVTTINTALISGFDLIPEIFPNTVTPFGMDGGNSTLFRISTPTFQSIHFHNTVTTPVIKMTYTVYRYVDPSTLTVIGSATIAASNVSFSLDFPQGDYIVCVRATGVSAQAGSFVAQFIGYPHTANFVFNFRVGEACSMIFAPVIRPPRECDEALFFQIEEGELPPGLMMDSQGTITGLLPNLDCLPDAPSPAVNWYFTDNDGTAWPWGRMWRFKVRVWIAGLEDASNDEEWFCVRIHNNWTFDLDNFLAEAPYEHIRDIRVFDPPASLPMQCAPCSQIEEVQFVPMQIDPICSPCLMQAEANRVELIAIPQEISHLAPSELVAWYISNKDKDTNNIYINKFIKDMETSDVFAILMRSYGHIEELPNNELEFVSLSNYQNYLQLAEIRLDPATDPNNLAVMINQWKDYMNQILPISGLGFMGESVEITLV